VQAANSVGDVSGLGTVKFIAATGIAFSGSGTQPGIAYTVRGEVSDKYGNGAFNQTTCTP
jgi:hypothetical protein